jgi:hypothetical protein
MCFKQQKLDIVDVEKATRLNLREVPLKLDQFEVAAPEEQEEMQRSKRQLLTKEAFSKLLSLHRYWLGNSV